MTTITFPRLPKKKLDALGKIFAAELDDRLPFQSRSKIYQELLAEGLVAEYQRVFGMGCRFPITVEGFVFTCHGRELYRASVKTVVTRDSIVVKERK